jgi:hypothetical protein
MDYLFSAPSTEDLIRLLRAWRFWVLGAVLGAGIGAAVHSIVPPWYRARATVNVDFNLEQAWPEETDRQHFYYLEREARKLEEIAWQDRIMQALAEQFGLEVEDLRGGILQLSQPAEAGWHFYADDPDPQTAAALASAWAEAFVRAGQEGIGAGRINEFVKLEVTQSADLPVEPRIHISGYMLAGSTALVMLASFVVLFFKPGGR